MLITNLMAKYANITTYLKIAATLGIIIAGYTFYHYKVTVPYKELESKYNTLRIACDRAPVECIKSGRDIIQEQLEEGVKTNLERIIHETPKIVVDDNATTFTFSN